MHLLLNCLTIKQIPILVINYIMVCKSYICHVNFTKSRHSSKIGIIIFAAKFQSLIASNTYFIAFFEFTRLFLEPLFVVSWIWSFGINGVLCYILQTKKAKHFLVCKLHICHVINAKICC